MQELVKSNNQATPTFLIDNSYKYVENDWNSDKQLDDLFYKEELCQLDTMIFDVIDELAKIVTGQDSLFSTMDSYYQLTVLEYLRNAV